MKEQYFRVYNDHLKLVQNFNFMVIAIEVSGNEFLESRQDYKIDWEHFKIEFPTYCINYVTAKRENFIGKNIDHVIFNESCNFSGELVNDILMSLSKNNQSRGETHALTNFTNTI